TNLSTTHIYTLSLHDALPISSALAYQYGLNNKTLLEKSFRFVVIDEAFSKSDDRNAQYALELFKKLGLQLLVVTPLDKLDVIKPDRKSTRLNSSHVSISYAVF